MPDLRVLVLRVLGLRVAVLRAADPVPLPAVPDAALERLADDDRLAAALARVAPDPLLARPELLLVAEAPLPELRDAVDLRAPPDEARLEPAELRAPAPELREPELDDLLSSSVHLPDITRCAASATASAISEPSRVALDITVVAALLAESAASRPASRILRRAAGLALIAAAAAASPAASISRLIAALASLSTVLSFLLDDELPDEELRDEELVLPCLAIAGLPLCRERHFKAVTVP